MTHSTPTPPARAITRRLIGHEVYHLPALWALFAAGVALLVGILALFTTPGSSAWETASALVRWYAAGVGGALMAVQLPLYVAHGFTRREFLGQMPVYLLAFVTTLSILMALGYALEAGIYGALGWQQTLSSDHLFTAPTQFEWVLTEFWLLHLVWATAGMCVGAAFYRNAGLGILAIVPGLFTVAVAESAVGTGMIGPVPVVVVAVGGAAAGAAAVCLILAFLGLSVAWSLGRNTPLRSPGR